MLETKLAPDLKPQLYSVAETAYLLSIGQRTVRRLIHTDAIRSVRINRSVRIPADEIDRIVAEGAKCPY